MKNLLAASLFGVVLVNSAFAQVQIDDPWVRATVPQQKVTGAFMRITASDDSRLVAAQSGLSGKVELHEMVMERDIMKMRPVSALELPAGKAVELKPGAHHLMLFDLRRPVREGETVSLELVIERKDGRRETIRVDAPVRPLHTTNGGDHGR